MKKYFVFVCLLGWFLPLLAQNTKKLNSPEMSWWYNQPAKKYWEGLPIATGRFAAMISGGINQEVIPFNDETLWSGGPYNPNNPQGPQILEDIRKKILIEKDYAAASKASSRLGSIPLRVQHYQPMGILHLGFNHDEAKAQNYQRKLSMDSATVTITYQLNGVNYKREIFASYPDQVVVMRITASKPKSINLKASLSSLQQSAVTQLVNGDIVMNGTTTELNQEEYAKKVLPAAMKWQSRLKVNAEGGKTNFVKNSSKTGDEIQITGANAVVIMLAGATNWVNYNDVSANEKERCNDYIVKAAKFKYPELKNRHLKDYMPLFASCKIDLGGHEKAKMNTTDRILALRKGAQDPLYISQYFQYGRYLMLAGARENTLAFNNHNIWLDNMEGRWQGRWTLNINIQECYWPVESTNLAVLNESLLTFTEILAQAGARTAKELYGCRGWVAHHGTDIWFNTAPTDPNPKASVWPMGGAWIMQQLFDHYTYEPDAAYLKRIYPLMKGSAEFILDFLVKDPETGYLVTCPSTSPENNFFTAKGEEASVSAGSSMDNQIIRNLFRNCITAIKVLGEDAAFAKKLEDTMKQLPPHQIGQFGQLQEWLHDFKEMQVGHRHISHLFASYPDDDITLRKTPELAKAVKVVLDRRGNINKGWSGAWKINQQARFEQPEEAYQILKSMLTDISIHPREEDSDITPSFEGNQGIQGITAGVTEMLMQSHSNELYLLPAVPKDLKDGHISGLRARGGYNVNISWENHQLKEAAVSSKFTQTCNLRSKTPVKILLNKQVIKLTKTAENLYTFNIEAGKTYTVLPN